MQFRTPFLAATAALTTSVIADAQQLGTTHLQTVLNTEAEIVAWDAGTQRFFVTDPGADEIDIYQSSGTPGSYLTSFASVALAGSPNSVAVKNGLVAVAVEGATKQDPGQVQFFNVDGTVNGAAVTVGALPDMLIFTPDGTKVIVANEGEADVATGLVNPEGSVSIVDVATRTAATASFAPLNGSKVALQAAGVRLADVNGVTLSQDVEPEYITVCPDSSTAYVTVQEANSIAVVDIATATVTELRPMGEQDFSLQQNASDFSNADGIDGNAKNFNVLGYYMPDAITSFEVGGVLYYATANEGDGRGDFQGFEDETRGHDLEVDLDLDIEAPLPDTGLYTLTDLNDDAVLGRLKFATSDYDIARGDTDGDGDVDQLYCFGARSFTIFNAATGAIVYDSANDFEQLMLPMGLFQDGRSDDKGPEPEAITLGVVGGTPILFVGLERTSAILAYDVTDPAAARVIGTIDLVADGSVSPEGLAFVPAAQSPTGADLLAVASEVSGTLGLYELTLEDFGAAYCFGDGSGLACPCANNGAAGNGCANGTTAAGANLAGTGVTLVGADAVVLTATGIPANQPALFLQGDVRVAFPFGDGLQCVGGSLVRLGFAAESDTTRPDDGVVVSTELDLDLSLKGGVTAGDTRSYQVYYRDPAGSICGNGFNTTNGLEIQW